MSRILVGTILFAGWVALLAGCKDDSSATGSGAATTAPAGAGARGPVTSAGPTKAGAYQVLQEFAQALDAKDYDRAVTYFRIPPNATADQFKTRAPEMIARQAVSKEGVDILGTQGKWGKLAEVFPATANIVANSMQVPVEECYGLSHEEAEAGFHWTGQEFKIIHCTNVGKLKK